MSDLPLGGTHFTAHDNAVSAAGSPLPTPSTAFDAYETLVRSGALADDPGQRQAMQRLQHLSAALAVPAAASSWFGRLLSRKTPLRAPRGVYLVGDVGRGKTMLMDLFFDHAPEPRRRRLHFHRFMQDVHQRLHDLKRSHPGLADPMPVLAGQIALQARLLCFDEFQVNDIADAMILGRLFEALFAAGTVTVATSNTRPEALFQDRPGADAFRPFIAVLQREMDTLTLDGPTDYRRSPDRGAARAVGAARAWQVPVDARATAALDAAFAAAAGEAAPHAESLTVMGRALPVPLAAGPVARFDFEALCGAFLGAGDYLAIARRFPVLVLDGVPRLGPENYDRARRFIVLVDALYDAKVKLFASADDVPDRLYQRGEGARAFERTASRLEEMRGDAYRALPHQP